MLRIDMLMLSKKNELNFYQEVPYNGIAFGFEDGILTHRDIYKNGVKTGEYQGDVIPLDLNNSIVNYMSLKEIEEAPDSPYELNGTLFNGVAIEMYDGFCVAIYTFENGWIENKVYYRLDGQIDLLDIIENGFAQRVEFFKNEMIKSVYFFKENSFHADFVFDDDGRLSSLNIEGKYFDQIEGCKLLAGVPSIKFCNLVDDVLFSDSVLLSGLCVDFHLLSNLLNNSSFKLCSKLVLWRTALTNSQLSFLPKLTALKTLKVESDEITFDTLKKFKVQNADCYVELNREEVSA